jgi:hypothetical protein
MSDRIAGLRVCLAVAGAMEWTRNWWEAGESPGRAGNV